MLNEYGKNIDIEKILAGYDLASVESCNFVRNHLAKKSLEFGGVASTAATEISENEMMIYKNVVCTMLKTKLKPDDAIRFTQIAIEVWTYYTKRVNTNAVNTVVSLQEVVGQPTDHSKVVDG